MRLYAVVGKPVFHSKSPQMFRSVFAKYNLDANYLAFAADSAYEAIDVAKKIGMAGLNVTSPYKEDVLKFVDQKDNVTETIGAANTLIFIGGKTFAFNTDIQGVRGALIRNNVEINGKKVAILGAGGSAKAAAFSLSEFTLPFIFNRSVNRAEKIAKQYDGLAYSLSDTEKLAEMDVIISCLPDTAGLEYEELLKEGQTLLDANYVGASRKREALTERGVKYIDGREWLIFQAIYSIRHFFGIEVSYDTLRDSAYESRKRKELICLVGFMGSGKTLIGRQLAERIKVEFIDTDELIEKKEGMSVERIFAMKGEGYFRRVEEDIVIEVIKNKKEAVISLGGGSVLSEKVRQVLKEHAITVWLWAEKETILKRTIKEANRPLLKIDSLELLMEKRLPLYAQMADLLLSTEDKTPETITDRLKMEIEYGLNSD